MSDELNDEKLSSKFFSPSAKQKIYCYRNIQNGLLCWYI